jgi:hydrogenase maturation protein HypF
MAGVHSGPVVERVVRERLLVRGAVQGVGFRPFAYRLARTLELSGFVENSAQGVTIEVEGPEARVAGFKDRLLSDRPPLASVRQIDATRLPANGEGGFAVRESDRRGEPSALVLPDMATCPECLRELRSPHDRRYRYPFTNCTNCGPRYSIVLDLPYDRARTTMARFTMCARCRAEYEDPGDRRFHAEPNACPECGPRLELRDAEGRSLALREGALRAAAEALRNGHVLAVKGLGGFHLLVDARRDDAVHALRRRKHREEKPLAVMVPSLSDARAHAHLDGRETSLLSSPEAPIVLVRRRAGSDISAAVAPGNP